MSQRDIKEAFVSNLNGTSQSEITLGSLLAPLCLVNRGLLLILCSLDKGVLPFHWAVHLLVEFGTWILPLVLSCTVFSDNLMLVVISVVAINVSLAAHIYSRRKHGDQDQNGLDTFLQMSLESTSVPFVTVFRVLVNVKTAISILAVDFSVFPRRYAKTETYGTGLMDFGVGAYVLANSLVCPEARRKRLEVSKFSYVFKQLLAVWPLVLLGVARLVSVKLTGYHEHISEYGVHWNFFFTLAVVRVIASLLLALFPPNRSWVLALVIGGLYQTVLEATQLKTYIIQSSDRSSSFLSANREGVFSILGYLTIYMAGVQVGLYLMQTRRLVKEWVKATCHLLLVSGMLWVALCLCQTYVEPVSRRLANLAFCFWILSQSLFFLPFLSITDLILLFFKRVSNVWLVSVSWKAQNNETEEKRGQIEKFSLIKAVNRNQLLFFLLANLMTGLINVLVDTVESSDLFSVCLLVVYMFVNCFVVYVLHQKEVTVKFW